MGDIMEDIDLQDNFYELMVSAGWPMPDIELSTIYESGVADRDENALVDYVRQHPGARVYSIMPDGGLVEYVPGIGVQRRQR